MNSETTLITGASSGSGFELAREFGRHGHSLILTAPVQSELELVARKLQSETGAKVQVIARDLEQPDAAREIYELAQAEAVEILVNNAGLGHLGNFWELPMDSILSMIRLNIEGLVRRSRLFLPDMVRRKSGRILNTASVAGFEPGPKMATYHATKAFVLSLSASLVEELRDTGVSVTALCPGATDTDFLPKADMSDTKLFQKGHVMASQDVAAEGYEALLRSDPIYVVGGLNKAQFFVRRFMTKTAQARMALKMYQKVPASKQKRH